MLRTLGGVEAELGGGGVVGLWGCLLPANVTFKSITNATWSV